WPAARTMSPEGAGSISGALSDIQGGTKMMNDEFVEPRRWCQAAVLAAVISYLAWSVAIFHKLDARGMELREGTGGSVAEARRALDEYSSRVNQWLVLSDVIGVFSVAAVGLRKGLRTLRFGPYPPPGANVLWRQRIVRSSAAKRKAVFLLWGCGIMAIVATWRLVSFLRAA